MRVAMYYSNKDVRVEEMPLPKIGSGEILVKIIASGICGSDGMEWYRVGRGPMVLGHEIAGEIVEVGEGVKRFKVGDRVTVAHHVPCNTCHYCLSGHHAICETLTKGTRFDPGGFCEYVRVPAINVDRGTFIIPDEVTYEEASFSEPLGCVVRGQRLAHIRPGQTVHVVGCGISGLLHIMAARALGAGRIIATDTIDYRLEAARKLGAEVTINADDDVAARIRKVNNGRLADLAVLCRAAFINQVLQSVDRGGTVLFFAAARPEATIPMGVNDLFWRTEITLTSSYASPPDDTIMAIELIRAKRVPVAEMITHRLSLKETGLGIQLITHPMDQPSIKVIVEPQR